MKSIPKIVRILDVKPFKINLLWSTNEIREIDFDPLFVVWSLENDHKMASLKDWEAFKQVVLSPNNTLSWPNILVSFSFKGITRSEPLEIDAQELYRQSTLVKKMEDISIGALLRKARIKAGLSQADVALKSGTSRHYISRIENDKSDIQLETFQKIVELGIGKKVVIEIQ